MKKESVNQFNQGMNLDLHPTVTPNSVLTDNLNGTFITYNGNEFCLQNDKGNFEVASLSEGYVPIGAKEYNGIIYIVSVKNKLNENGEIIPEECVTEIGTYPGVDWTIPYEKENNLILPENKLENQNCYTPLQNVDVTETINENDEITVTRGSFSNLKLGYTTQTPVTIEIQPSYDGSVNLIITDGVNPVRMINSGFSVLPQNKYKLIKRRQTVETNQYISSDLQSLELIKNSNTISNVELVNVLPGGQLKGGNYTFYIKFGDGDYNQTDVVAESGIVSIFKGTNGHPTTISGTLLDERTDKSIKLKIINIDRSFSKIYVYYTREYSDTLGYRLTEAGMLKEPFDIEGYSQEIFITGFEQTEVVNIEELNVDYHTFDNARAMTQQQNMLFLGNLKQNDTWAFYNKLKDQSLSIVPKQCQKVTLDATSTLFTGGKEYYDVKNIYNYVGYWPDEFYRFGIVYILQDGSTTPVFNVKGNIDGEENDYGIVKTTKVEVITKNTIKPICFEFNVAGIDDPRIKGYFIVRQKRIPITLCQGLSIGIDQRTHLPITWNGANWITESFLSVNRYKAYEACNTAAEEGAYDDTKKVVWSYRNHNGKNSLPELEPTVELKYTNTRIFKEASEINKPDYLWKKLSETNHIDWSNETKLDGTPYTDFNDWFNYNGDNAGGNFFGYNEYISIEGQVIPEYICKTVFVPAYKYNSENGSYEEVENYDKSIIYITVDPVYETYFDFNRGTWYRNDVPNPINVQDPSSYSEKYDINDCAEDKYKFISYGHLPKDKQKNGSGLLSVDPIVVPNIRNILDGSQFNVRKEYDVITSYGPKRDVYYANTDNNSGSYLLITDDVNGLNNEIGESEKCIYISPNTNVKTVDNFAFSNVAGNVSDFKNVAYVSDHLGVDWWTNNGEDTRADGFMWCAPVTDTGLNKFESGDHTGKTRADNNLAGFNSTQNINVVRGLFTPYVGIASNRVSDNMGIYSIRLENGGNDDQCLIRQQDESPYFTVSKRQEISNNTIDVYRGDCFTCTVGVRILTNFIDNTAPSAEMIVDPLAWRFICAYHRYGLAENKNETNNISNVNLSDVNNVNLGYWVTFKCLSSYNLGIRSLDYSHEDEQNLLGSPRSFFPLNGGNTATGNKMPESTIFNDGYAATVGEKRFNLLPDVPYQTSEFANRIIFSNVYVDGSFSNGYRVFQGLSYKDYDKQYGAIVKLVPWDNNLLVVMEHGVGVVGVNEQALMQTSTTDTIHIYGHGVLSDHMQIISPDFGSKYEHSVIRTPLGVYGVDTDVRKIWRFSTQKGFETLSDMKIESYLNDNMFTNEKVEMEICDVRTHYNETKGDIMFTFFKRNNAKNTAASKTKNYFSISTATVEMSMNSTASVTFTTDLPANQISIETTELVSATIDFNKKKIVITSSGNYGSGKVVVNGKTIPVKVRSTAEDFAKEQQENMNETGTSTETHYNEETGETETVVVSNVKATFGKSSMINHGDYTYQKSSVSVKFTNNVDNITVNDCDVVVEGVEAEINKLANKIQFTATTPGNMVIKLFYKGREIGKSDVIVIRNSNMSVSTTSLIVYNGYTASIMCVSANTKKAVTTSILTGSECVDVKVASDGRKVIFTGKKEGVANINVSDGTTTIRITVTVKGDVPLEDLIWHTTSGPYHEYHSGDTITLPIGTNIELPYKCVPEDYNPNLYYTSVSSYDTNIIAYNQDGTILTKNVGTTTIEINIMKVCSNEVKDPITGQKVIAEVHKTCNLNVRVTE